MIYSANTVLGAVGDYFEDLAGRSATDAELSFYLGRYRGSPDLGAIRTEIARTPDVRDALATLFRSVVGTDPDPARLDQLQQALVDGATLDDIGGTLEPANPLTPDDDGNGTVPPHDTLNDTPNAPDEPGQDRQGAVATLYGDVLGREADPAGLKFWLESGAPLHAIREALAGSGEARIALDTLYADVLGRPGDDAGLAFWQGQLVGGNALPGLRAALAGSGEARDAVAALYQAVLGRDADAAGLEFWQGQVASGLGLGDVREALAGSSEAATTLPPGKTLAAAHDEPSQDPAHGVVNSATMAAPDHPGFLMQRGSAASSLAMAYSGPLLAPADILAASTSSLASSAPAQLGAWLPPVPAATASAAAVASPAYESIVPLLTAGTP